MPVASPAFSTSPPVTTRSRAPVLGFLPLSEPSAGSACVARPRHPTRAKSVPAWHTAALALHHHPGTPSPPHARRESPGGGCATPPTPDTSAHAHAHAHTAAAAGKTPHNTPPSAPAFAAASAGASRPGAVGASGVTGSTAANVKAIRLSLGGAGDDAGLAAPGPRPGAARRGTRLILKQKPFGTGGATTAVVDDRNQPVYLFRSRHSVFGESFDVVDARTGEAQCCVERPFSSTCGQLPEYSVVRAGLRVATIAQEFTWNKTKFAVRVDGVLHKLKSCQRGGAGDFRMVEAGTGRVAATVARRRHAYRDTDTLVMDIQRAHAGTPVMLACIACIDHLLDETTED